MSITITVSKEVIASYPQVSYQLFYLSEHEYETGQLVVFVPKVYYRELTRLLDLYQIPYRAECSQSKVLMHVLMLEKDRQLAGELGEQFCRWGFGKVTLSCTYRGWKATRKNHRYALTLIDSNALSTMSAFERVHLWASQWAHPLIALTRRLGPGKLCYWVILQKPFTASQLREAVERLLHVIL